MYKVLDVFHCVVFAQLVRDSINDYYLIADERPTMMMTKLLALINNHDLHCDDDYDDYASLIEFQSCTLKREEIDKKRLFRIYNEI